MEFILGVAASLFAAFIYDCLKGVIRKRNIIDNKLSDDYILIADNYMTLVAIRAHA